MKFKLLLISLLLVSALSCQNVEDKPFIIFPSYFLTDTADPNTVSPDYMERMKKYDAILATSPVPVYIIDETEFITDIFLKIDSNYPLEKMSNINILGLYFYGKNVGKWPNEFIFINKRLNPDQIIVTYFHELGHYMHRKNGCKGCIDNPITRESHALYYELKMGWEYELPYALESSIRTMALYTVSKDSNITYKMAVFEVMKTSLWKQTLTFLKDCEEGK